MGMDSWAFRHYRLREGHNSLPNFIFWLFINVFQIVSHEKKIFSRNMWIAKESWISTFNTESWGPRGHGYWSPTFGAKNWNPKALKFQSPTFGIKSWRLGAQCSWSSTFWAKSWILRTQSFWDSTFDVESWTPIAYINYTYNFISFFNVDWIDPKFFILNPSCKRLCFSGVFWKQGRPCYNRFFINLNYFTLH